MKRSAPPPLSTLELAIQPYAGWLSNRLGTMASSLWIEGFELSEIYDEEWMEAKFSACFGLRELLESNTNRMSFSSQDIEMSRFVIEALHLGIELAIIFPRRGIDLFNLFERLVAMTTLMRSQQEGLEPTHALKEIAMAINQPATSRKLSQCSGKHSCKEIEEAFVVASNPFEQGILDGLLAISEGIIEPFNMVAFIGSGGDAVC